MYRRKSCSFTCSPINLDLLSVQVIFSRERSLPIEDSEGLKYRLANLLRSLKFSCANNSRPLTNQDYRTRSIDVTDKLLSERGPMKIK